MFSHCCSDAKSCPTLCDPVDCSTADFPFTVSQSWLKFMSVDLVMPVNHLILCRPFSSCPHSFPASWSFQWVSSSHQVAEVLDMHPSSFQSCWIVAVVFQQSKCKCNRWSVGLAEKPPSGSPSKLQNSARVLLFLHGPGQTVLVLFHWCFKEEQGARK